MGRGFSLCGLVLVLVSSQATALTIIPGCEEPNGSFSQYMGGDSRFGIVSRQQTDGSFESAFVDCAGTTDIFAIENPDAADYAWSMMDKAMNSGQVYTMDEVVDLLNAAGHDARLVRDAPRSCVCNLYVLSQ